MDPFLKEYAEQYRIARSPQQKMILIDTLIHRYHWELEGGLTGPGARNLIGGKTNELIDFLNHLSYGIKSSPEILSTRQEWLDKVRMSREQYASAVEDQERKAEAKERRAQTKRLKQIARRERLAGQSNAGEVHDAT